MLLDESLGNVSMNQHCTELDWWVPVLEEMVKKYWKRSSARCHNLTLTNSIQLQSVFQQPIPASDLNDIQHLDFETNKKRHAVLGNRKPLSKKHARETNRTQNFVNSKRTLL